MANYKASSRITTQNWTDQYTPGSDFESILSSASANTFGAWQVINSDIGVGKVLKGILLTVESGLTAFAGCQLEIAEGATSSEVMKLRCVVLGTAQNYSIWIPFGYRFTDNANISVRVKDSVASALNVNVVLYYQ